MQTALSSVTLAIQLDRNNYRIMSALLLFIDPSQYPQIAWKFTIIPLFIINLDNLCAHENRFGLVEARQGQSSLALN